MVAVAVAVVALLVVGLVVFAPWKLIVDDVVDEAAPVAAVSAAPTASLPSSAPAEAPSSVSPTTLARGTFISHEHGTEGSVSVVLLADGSRVLRIEGLDTSNGPDLRVWLSDQAVVDGPSGWTVFDDGAYVELGKLKGNKGNQNYTLPAGVDLGDLTSVSIWCQRFRVSFGAAALS